MEFPDINTVIIRLRAKILNLLNKHENCRSELECLNNYLPSKYKVKIRQNSDPYQTLTEIEKSFVRFRDDHWSRE